MSDLTASETFLRDRLRLLRGKSGLTQEVIAELAGISSIYYQSIEAGRRPNVSLRIIDRIAEAYGLSIHELFAPRVPGIRIKESPISPPDRQKGKRLGSG